MPHMMCSFNMNRVSGVLLACIVALSACGGGGGSSGNNLVTPPNSSSVSSSIATTTVNISGTATYDYIPHNENHIGLNYAGVVQRPIRGAVVELLDDLGQLKVSTTSDSNGFFSADVQKNTLIKVRVKAQLLNTSLPSWNFKVTDNTSNNALYVLDGSLVSSGSNDSVRNLNANSGWGGENYTSTRSAAPFAILDDIYVGLSRVTAAGNIQSLNPLELHWSIKNSAADGDYTKGEIGTSFYDGSAIYILGDANNDTDEYDSHVLLHEWGHYIENELSRADSLGGDHSDGEFLDIRVAMSEGFANAFSGMMTDDSNYADASGSAQSSGFTFNIARKNRPNKGYFSEGSVGSIFYNFYVSSVNKVANDFVPVFKTLSNPSYYSSDAFTSIYLFHTQLKNQFPEYSALLETLMQEQSIFGTDEYGTGESNNGGLAIELPVYKTLNAGSSSVNICSSNQYGEPNKLGNSQFVKFTISQAGFYTIQALKAGGNEIISKPEFILFKKGGQVSYVANSLNDKVTTTINLAAGNYVLDLYDLNNSDNENIDTKATTCFDVQVAAN